MSIPQRLKSDLTEAMKVRDTVRVKTLRSLLSTIDNAGAIPIDPGPYEPKLGLSQDVPRREVTEDEIIHRFRVEWSDLLQAADEMRQHGQVERADELEVRAAIVAEYLS